MSYLYLYLATAIPFLAIDAVFLTLVIKPLFARYLGDMLQDSPQLGVAAVFYALYAAGVVYFAGLPALRATAGGGTPDYGLALLNGALLGALAYGTYEMTNKSTLKGWAWQMVATDWAWGTALTAGSAVLGVWIVAALGLWR